jgi:DNA polymerase-3 subunit alpha
VEEMAQNRVLFVERAVERKFSRAKAEKMFDLMAYFAGYGFNKSHSTAYALLSYQTAYLKAHYPREFLAASLTSEMGDTDRVVVLIGELQRLDLPLLPPDVNGSFVDFRCEGEGVRFGLGAVKNVGRSAIESMVEAREKNGPFASIFHFCENLDMRLFNRRVLESLVQAGAFDSIEPNRAALLAVCESALDRAARIQADRDRGQTLLFDGGEGGSSLPEPQLPEVEAWSRREALEREKKVLGFYVSGHPLADFAEDIALANATASTLGRFRDGDRVALAGIVTGVRQILDRKGDPMAFVQVEDFSGSAEVILFSRAFQKYGAHVMTDEPLLFRGGLSHRTEENPKVMVEEILPLSEVRSRFVKHLRIHAPLEELEEELLAKMAALLESHPGSCPVQIWVDAGEGGSVQVRSRKYRVDPKDRLIQELRKVVGKGKVALVGNAAE